MTNDTKQNDLAFDTAYILYALASNYTGEVRGEILNLAERLKTDQEVSDSLREKSIANLEKVLIRMSTRDEMSMQFAASKLFDIFSSTYQMKKPGSNLRQD